METIHMVRRRLIWISVNTYLFIAALMAGSRALLILAEVLACLFLLSRLYLYVVLNSIRLTRSSIKRAYENQTVRVSLSVHYLGILPIQWLYVRDTFPASCGPAHKFLIPYLSRTKRKSVLTYQATCNAGRGRYQTGPAVVTGTDPLGLWIVEKTMPGLQNLIVLPEVVQIPNIWDFGRSNPHHLGRIECNLPRSFDEFCGTREYRHGDNLVHIHWPATAHRGQVIIREFESRITSRVVVFLDLDRKSLCGARPSNLDYSVRIAASMAECAAANSRDFCVVGHCRRPWHSPVGRSRSLFLSILDQLATVSADGDRPITEVVRSWLPELHRGDEVVFIINTGVTKPGDYDEHLTTLQRKRIPVTIVFIISDSFGDAAPSIKRTEFLRSPMPSAFARFGARIFAVARHYNIAECFSTREKGQRSVG